MRARSARGAVAHGTTILHNGTMSRVPLLLIGLTPLVLAGAPFQAAPADFLLQHCRRIITGCRAIEGAAYRAFIEKVSIAHCRNP